MKRVILPLLLILFATLFSFSYLHLDENWDLKKSIFSHRLSSPKYTLKFHSNAVKYRNLIKSIINDVSPAGIISNNNYAQFVIDETATYNTAPEGSSWIWVRDERKANEVLASMSLPNPFTNKQYLTINSTNFDLTQFDNTYKKMILTHEFMHGCGLLHTNMADPYQSVYKKIMYYIARNREAVISDDEKNGIYGLYIPARFDKEYTEPSHAFAKPLKFLKGNNETDFIKLLPNIKSYDVDLFWEYKWNNKNVNTAFANNDFYVGSLTQSTTQPVNIPWRWKAATGNMSADKAMIKVFAKYSEDNKHYKQKCLEAGSSFDAYIGDKPCDSLEIELYKFKSNIKVMLGELKLDVKGVCGKKESFFAEADGLHKGISFVRYQIKRQITSGQHDWQILPYNGNDYLDITYGQSVAGSFKADITLPSFLPDGHYKVIASAYNIKGKVIDTDEQRFFPVVFAKWSFGKSDTSNVVNISELQNNILPIKLTAIAKHTDPDNINSPEQYPTRIEYFYSYSENNQWSAFTKIGEAASMVNDYFNCDWNLSNAKGGKYRIKAIAHYVDNSTEEETTDLTLKRTLSILSPSGTLCLKPSAKGTPNPFQPLQEIDTLAVKVLEPDATNWNGVEVFAREASGEEVLKGGFISAGSKTSGLYRTYKFSFNYQTLTEGMYEFGARFVNDTASFAVNKVKLIKSVMWQNFEGGMAGWTSSVIANMGNPLGGGGAVGNPSFGISPSAAGGFECTASVAGQTAMRAHLTSPSFTVPAADSGYCFMYFDYKREFPGIYTGGDKSLMATSSEL